jgi:aryl-alcohol dehydrogenase-like predicted oxidoreductase
LGYFLKIRRKYVQSYSAIPMEMIKIPHTDLEVSRLAMGCMGLGGGWGSGTQLTGNLDHQPGNVKETALLVQKYAQRHETTPEAILLAWLLKHPAKIQPVLGTSRPDRLRACAKAVSVSLSRDEWYSLFAAARGAIMP